MDDLEDLMPFQKAKKEKAPAPKPKKPAAIKASVEHSPLALATELLAEPPPEENDDSDFEEELGETLLGLPISHWTPDEKTYIGDREREILETLGAANRGTALPLVHEVITCDIQMKRLDRDIEKVRRRDRKDLAKMTVSLKPLNAMRSELMDRLTAAMNNLGIMPKNFIQVDPAAVTLTDLHKKYLAEIDLRRKEGWKVGTLGKEAAALAVQIGSQPETYSSPRALEDKDRDEIWKA